MAPIRSHLECIVAVHRGTAGLLSALTGGVAGGCVSYRSRLIRLGEGLVLGLPDDLSVVQDAHYLGGEDQQLLISRRVDQPIAGLLTGR